MSLPPSSRMSVRLKPMWPPVFSTVPTAVSFPVPGAADIAVRTLFGL